MNTALLHWLIAVMSNELDRLHALTFTLESYGEGVPESMSMQLLQIEAFLDKLFGLVAVS